MIERTDPSRSEPTVPSDPTPDVARTAGTRVTATPGDPPPSSAIASADRVGAGPPGRPGMGWTEIAVGAVAYLVLSVVGVLIIGIPGTPGGPGAVPSLVVFGGGTLLAAGLALAVRVRWLPAVGLRATTLRWILIGIGAGLLARVLAVGVVIGWVALTGDMSNPQQFLADGANGTGASLLGMLLFGALLVPLAEELLVRGVLYGALRRYGIVLAVIVSSVVFGLMHGINVALPVAIVLGAVNALLYERSRSIWPAVASHAIFNAAAFTLAAALL